MKHAHEIDSIVEPRFPTFMSLGVEIGVASIPSPRDWAPTTDDRWRVAADRRLALVCDASGPTYGGYHAPISVDRALAEIERAFAASDAPPNEALEAAVASGHALAHADYRAYERLRERLLAHTPDQDRLTVALDASKAFARENFGVSIDAFVHFAASLTALAIDPERRQAALAQLGNSRGYRRRGDVLELLIAEHSISAQSGAIDCTLDLRFVCTTLLGMSTTPACRAELRSFTLSAGDRFLLCTDGVWAELDDREIAAQLVRDLPAERIAQELCEQARRECGDDSTAMVVIVG